MAKEYCEGHDDLPKTYGEVIRGAPDNIKYATDIPIKTEAITLAQLKFGFELVMGERCMICKRYKNG